MANFWDDITTRVNGQRIVASWFNDLKTVGAGTVTNSITAYAGGGQANATSLTTQINRITTCATAGDSVKLPLATAGKKVTVYNDGATALDIYPQSGENIDPLADNVALRISAGGKASFECAVATTWKYIANQAEVITTKTTTATLTTAESGTILADSSGGAYTINLPTAVGNLGLRYKIKKTTSDLSLVTIDPNSTQTLDSYTTFALAFQHEEIDIISDNANWKILNHYMPFVGVHYNSNAGYTPTNAATRYVDYEDLVYTSHSGLVSGTGSGMTTATNTGWKLTSPVDAYWHVAAANRFVGTFNANGYVYLSVRVNDVAKISRFFQTDFGSAGDTPQGIVDGDVYVGAGQRIEIEIYYVAGGNKSLSTDQLQNYITAHIIRRA